MAGSLRARLTLALVAVNAGILAILSWWLASEMDRQAAELAGARERTVVEMVNAASQTVRPRRAGDLAEVLLEGPWEEFPQAVLVDDKVAKFDGELMPVGAELSPAGSRRRRLDFPHEEILAGVSRAAREDRIVFNVAGGVAIPIVGNKGRAWGAVYLAMPAAPEPRPNLLPLLLGLAAATVAGALLVYLLFGRGVITPVERLAAAVREFGRGRMPKLEEQGHGPEFEELLHALRDMMARIRGFQGELEQEVRAATERAQNAERRAARQDRLAAMGTLAAGLAHEINSPLAGALQGMETLRREARSERAKRYGELTSEALGRIGSLVQRLLRLAPARLESGSCNLVEVLADLPDFLASRLQRHRLQLEPAAEEIRVSGAPGDLFPVFLNLVQNALDALDEVAAEREPDWAGTVRIEARADADGSARVRVLDDGPGVEAELLPHLFEPFVTSKEVGHGTGLGLALAHATVRQLGGDIEARNRAEGGLEVEVRLTSPPAA